MNSIFKFSVLVLFLVAYSTANEYKLTYFAVRGRGEFIRFIFAAANQKFEDNRVKGSDWAELKPTTPFGSLPTLEIKNDDETVVLAQSLAIAQYLADQFDLNGEDEIESALINMYGNQLGDLFDATIGRNLTDSELNRIVTTNLNFFEDRLIKNGSGYLVGNKLSWADIYLSQMTEFLGDYKTKYLSNYPKVKRLDDSVRSLPGVADWIEKRPQTPF
ncbi:unnamed protein product [Brachionus calyciflorus]|uniref:glutathione transferase n=1 Tax=Brachionus calyciflorus TaxID=104777 RepID=A0A3G2JSD0_9BILA|nr:glutathione S-transferase S6 [Brachionus calyciflorus]CAF0841660.1 unnamed protein product [Brachionus calyciflorus]